MSDTSSPSPRLQDRWSRLQQGLQATRQRFAAWWAFDLRLAIHDLYQVVTGPLRWLEGTLVLGGLSTVVAEYGFGLSPWGIARIHDIQTYIVWTYLAIFLLRLGLMSQRWSFLKQHKILAILPVLLLADLLVFQTAVGRQWLGVFFHSVDVKHIAVLYVVFIQGFILLIVLLEGAYASQAVAVWQIRPAQTLVLSFLGLITLGSLLLMLPNATTNLGSMPFLKALFSATSAVCVTGLIVVDTATYFTPLGQGILLGLFQLGGLGIITFATVFGMMLRGGMGVREKLLLQDFVASRQFGEITATVGRIVWLTLLLEGLGVVSLYYSWQGVIPEPGTRLWFAVFHAVSAFCNAGFSTFSDGLAGPGTAMQPSVNVTIMVLIVLGGIGFSVLWEGGQWLSGTTTGRKQRLSVQSRLVWIMTGLLIVVGAGLFALLEMHGVLAGRSGGERLLGALFQSITARTAGFNTLSIDSLTVPTAYLLILLMVVGASPGSTGGGVKTTTVAVLMMSTVATFRGKARVEAFRRTLPRNLIDQAYATFFFSITVMTLSLFILTITETHAFIDLFFEEVSAFGTVGLSRGVTPSLSDLGQIVIIVSMFVGRVGSLTLGVALARQVVTTAYEYPAESVMVG
jgi:trk system potassium uptake protein TrkH